MLSATSETRNKINLCKIQKKKELIEKVKENTLQKIKSFAISSNQGYKELMQQLIVQGMVKMLEPTCFIRVRNSDVDFVKQLIPKCQSQFSELMKKETGFDFKCALEIDQEYLGSQ